MHHKLKQTRNIRTVFEEIEEECANNLRKKFKLGKNSANEESLELNTFLCQNCLKIFNSQGHFAEHSNFCAKKKESTAVDDRHNTRITATEREETSNTQVVENGQERQRSVDIDTEEIPEDDYENNQETDEILEQDYEECNLDDCCYICSDCNIKCSNLAELNTHFSAFHSQHKCVTCNKVYNSKDELETHRLSHEENINETREMEKTSENNAAYVQLINLQCEICDKSFNSRAGYLGHMKIHTTDNFCAVCCNSYTSKFKLDMHLASHMEKELEGSKLSPCFVQCKVANCTELFNSKLQLYNHKKKHFKKSEFICDLCGLPFVHKSALDKHKFKHSIKINCDICEKTFVNKKTLSEHVRIHTGELPYSCKLCEAKFRCHSGLKYHETAHSTEKKYKCSHCGTCFARYNYLKEHLRKHMNEKPYECEFCFQKFIQLNILKRHIANMHRTCELCNEMVGNIKESRAHIWKKHLTTSIC